MIRFAMLLFAFFVLVCSGAEDEFFYNGKKITEKQLCALFEEFGKHLYRLGDTVIDRRDPEALEGKKVFFNCKFAASRIDGGTAEGELSILRYKESEVVIDKILNCTYSFSRGAPNNRKTDRKFYVDENGVRQRHPGQTHVSGCYTEAKCRAREKEWVNAFPARLQVDPAFAEMLDAGEELPLVIQEGEESFQLAVPLSQSEFGRYIKDHVLYEITRARRTNCPSCRGFGQVRSDASRGLDARLIPCPYCFGEKQFDDENSKLVKRPINIFRY